MLINLTPHTLNIEDVDGQMQAIPASGQIARLEMATHSMGTTEFYADLVQPNGTRDDGCSVRFAISATQPGNLTGLPPANVDSYIVSLIAAQAAWALGRVDVYAPGELIRNAAGQPVRCKGLHCNPAEK